MAEAGDPTDDIQYTVCVWDDVAGTPTLVMEMVALPGGNCVGRPCWRQFSNGKGLRYKDPGGLPTGLTKLTLRIGPLGTASILVAARGAAMPDPPMPFQHEPAISVQIVNSLGTCWGADFVSAPRTNTDAKLVAKERP